MDLLLNGSELGSMNWEGTDLVLSFSAALVQREPAHEGGSRARSREAGHVNGLRLVVRNAELGAEHLPCEGVSGTVTEARLRVDGCAWPRLPLPADVGGNHPVSLELVAGWGTRIELQGWGLSCTVPDMADVKDSLQC